jgi:cytochrome c
MSASKAIVAISAPPCCLFRRSGSREADQMFPLTHRRSRFVAIVAIALGLAAPRLAQSQGMGGMMNGGMTSRGMMGGYGPPGEPGPSRGANPQWDQLSSYMQSNGLACVSCHAYSGRGTGPAFADIAQRFAGHTASRTELARAISNGVAGQWPGYPPMPGGLATPDQAKELAGLILRLPPS